MLKRLAGNSSCCPDGSTFSWNPGCYSRRNLMNQAPLPAKHRTGNETRKQHFAALLEAGRTGNREALNDLFALVQEGLAEYVCTVLHVRVKAKFGPWDVVQDALLHGLEKLAHFE